MIVIPDAVHLILPERYHLAIQTFQTLGLHYMIRAVDRTTGQLYAAIGRPKLDMMLNGVNLAALAIIIVPLVMRFGPAASSSCGRVRRPRNSRRSTPPAATTRTWTNRSGAAPLPRASPASRAWRPVTGACSTWAAPGGSSSRWLAPRRGTPWAWRSTATPSSRRASGGSTPDVGGLLPRVTWALFGLTMGAWEHPTPPGHLVQFSRATLGRLLRECGYEVAEFRSEHIPMSYSIGKFENAVIDVLTGRHRERPRPRPDAAAGPPSGADQGRPARRVARLAVRAASTAVVGTAGLAARVTG